MEPAEVVRHRSSENFPLSGPDGRSEEGESKRHREKGSREGGELACLSADKAANEEFTAKFTIAFSGRTITFDRDGAGRGGGVGRGWVTECAAI